MLIKLRTICLLMVIVGVTTTYGQNKSVQLANEYYRMGEVDKAVELYQTLAKSSRNIPQIHNNYLNVLLDLNDYKAATRYMDKILKWYPDNYNYRVDYGLVIVRQGDSDRADSYFHALIEEISSNQYGARRVVQYMLRQQLTDYAILTLKTTRSKMGDPFLFSIDLANIYRMQNNKQMMVEEYLNFGVQNPRNLQYIKNTFQVLLSEPEDLENLERMLFNKVQVNPDNEVYSEMLIWVSMQQKNFYGAFIQARAVDRRLQQGGGRVLNVGIIALNNEDYENAIMIFDYLADTYNESNIGVQARLYRIKARESLVKISYPVDTREVEKLIHEYDEFINNFPQSYITHQASLNEAKLYAQYLNNNDSAINIISRLLHSPRMNKNLQAQAKLDLADIYLLDRQPWESALLYAQVDKSMKESDLGYEAKLKNAKLAYYRGDFKLAQEYLDILKLATSRDIANDALALSIFIQSNTALDTSTVALQKYATIELMLFQNRVEEAIKSIDNLLTTSPGHELSDDLLYLKAGIMKESGNFEIAAQLMEKVFTEYRTGLLAAKANYEYGILYEDYIKDKERALEIFTEFLKAYPGSIYTTDARKRLRILRGDPNFVEQPQLN